MGHLCYIYLQNGRAGHIDATVIPGSKVHKFGPGASPLWSIFLLGSCRLHLGSLTGVPVSHPVISFIGLADEWKPHIHSYIHLYEYINFCIYIYVYVHIYIYYIFI